MEKKISFFRGRSFTDATVEYVASYHSSSLDYLYVILSFLFDGSIVISIKTAPLNHTHLLSFY